jgi:hypothetical protein
MGVSSHLMHSFAKHRGVRGVHFYDSSGSEFFQWNRVFGLLEKSEFPTVFNDKLVEAIANYNPDSEFVAVSAGNGQLTIEMFKAQAV